MAIDDVIAKLAEYPCRLVEITGGEPLVQKEACVELVRRLCDLGYEVLIETSGSLDIRPLDARSIRIVDVKCPGSGEAERTHWENLTILGPRDEVKFVIRDRADFEYAQQVITTYQLHQRGPEVLFSPVWGEVDLQDLAAWVLEAEERGVHGRMQLQLHKYIWGPDAKGV
jgi:7-carboxy-7-deazaguanine synthase